MKTDFKAQGKLTELVNLVTNSGYNVLIATNKVSADNESNVMNEDMENK